MSATYCVRSNHPRSRLVTGRQTVCLRAAIPIRCRSERSWAHFSETIATKITLLAELCVSASPTRSRGVQFAESPIRRHSITPRGRILGLSIARPLEIAHVGVMRLFLASLIGAVLANAPSAMACEGCKEPSSVAGNGGVDGISFGFSASVIFMLVMVFGILGGLFWMAARSCRQLEAVHRAAAAQTNWAS
jgi:hypothetical protein